MNSLFVRLWITLWLTIVVVVFLAIGVFDYARAQRMQPAVGPPERLLSQLATQAIAAVETGESLENWLRRVSSRHRQVFLLDRQGADLRGRQLPQHLQGALKLYGFRENARPGGRNRSRLLRRIPELDGLILAVTRLDPLSQFRWLTLEVLIALGFLVSGVVAVGLARYLTQPIRRLKMAADQVALGNFETTVAADLGGRRDELGELGERFDDMVAKLSLARSQQQGLLRDISHELRSPLARLLLTADLLPDAQGDELTSLQRRFKKDIDHLDTMIEEVLTLSRYESEGPELALSVVSVTDLLQGVLDDAQFEANALNKGVKSRIDSGNSDVFVRGDATQLKRAIENVLRNGVRHAPSGTQVEVAVTTGRCNDTESVFIAISDEGAGVDPADLERIFTPFFRSPEQRAQSAGYGIGLSLVKRIIESHGGQVIASNLPHSLDSSTNTTDSPAPRGSPSSVHQGFEVRITLPTTSPP